MNKSIMSVMCCFTVTFRRPPDLNIFFYDLILPDTLTNKTKSKGCKVYLTLHMLISQANLWLLIIHNLNPK